MSDKNKIGNLLWDLWCICSVVGIWPRFIEPKTLKTTHLKIPIANLPKSLDGLKILQFSDLHLNESTPNTFLSKLKRRIASLSPDIIVFTGDFLCYSQLRDKKRLSSFFASLPEAPYGNYAILGNHDYTHYVMVNDEGDYDACTKPLTSSGIKKGFERLFTKIKLTQHITPDAQSTPPHEGLIELIHSTPFKLLHNETVVIPIRDTHLNICGLGEYMAGRLLPDDAYKGYDTKYPGIILAHNPDSVPRLKDYPGDLILCGHTHGGQVNLPLIGNKFVLLENMYLKKGLVRCDDRWVYVNRGVGGVLNFRWFSPPEITLITLAKAHE